MAALPPADASLCTLLAFRLAGGYTTLLQHLQQPRTSAAALSFLRAAFARDPDAAHDFAVLGGHAGLQRLLASGSDEVVALVAEVAEASAAQGVAFPVRRAVQEGVRPGPQSFVLEGPQGVLVVRLRSVAQRQSAQRDTGFVLWPAAVILARMVHATPAMVTGKSVLEIGAGVGLAGLAAGLFASRVTVSDYNAAVLRNLRYNVELNYGDRAAMDVRFCDFNAFRDGGEADEENVGEEAVALDAWQEEAVRPGGDGYDCLLGSDMICCDSDAWSAAAVIGDQLRPGGTAYLVLADPRNRYGVETLPAALNADPRLAFEVAKVQDPDLMKGVTEEAGYLDWNLFTIRKVAP